MHLKHIPMDGPKNFRDLGGFMTCTGEVVAWNRLYRSDSLTALSDRDLELLGRLQVRTIVDLRSGAEQKAMPNRTANDITVVSCPMMREDFSTPGEAAGLSFAQSLKTGYLEILKENRMLVGAAAAAVMQGLSRGAVVFHCTAGKDRTGILAAILYLLLGVSREDIIADYQVSYTYNEKGVNRMAAGFPQLKAILDAGGDDTMFHSHPANIKAVLDALEDTCPEDWLEASGTDRKLIHSFRECMLEKGF